MTRTQILVLLGNLAVILGTVWVVADWPRIETYGALFAEVIVFSSLATLFWRGRPQPGKTVARLDKELARHPDVWKSWKPDALGKQLLAEIDSGRFNELEVKKVRELVQKAAWGELVAAWPELASTLFATRHRVEKVKDAALVVAYASEIVAELATRKA